MTCNTRRGETKEREARVDLDWPSMASPSSKTQQTEERRIAGDPTRENPSPGFLAPLIAADRRSNMMSLVAIPGSTTLGNAAAQALQALMLHSPEGEKN